MTQNYHPESILISGMTVRNLTHEFSIWAPFRGYVDSITPSYGARLRNAQRSGRSVVLEDLQRDASKWAVPWCKSAASYILASGQGAEFTVPATTSALGLRPAIILNQRFCDVESKHETKFLAKAMFYILRLLACSRLSRVIYTSVEAEIL